MLGSILKQFLFKTKTNNDKINSKIKYNKIPIRILIYKEDKYLEFLQ